METASVKLWQALVSGLSIGSIYALIAQSTTPPTSLPVLNFGQGVFLMIGELFGLTCYVTLGLGARSPTDRYGSGSHRWRPP